MSVEPLPFPASAPRLVRAFGDAPPPGVLADRVALWGPDGAAETYGALERQSAVLEAQLVEAGFGSGDRVVICLDRGPTLVAAMLAALRAGVTFVLVDPKHPKARIRAIIEQVRARGAWVDRLGDAALPPEPRRMWAQHPSGPPRGTRARVAPSTRGSRNPQISDASLAYIHFTSGSTGQPKGAAISRAALWAFLDGAAQSLGIGGDDRVLAWNALSFDVSLLELLLPLWVGASTELLDSESATSPRMVAQRLDSAPVTVVQGTPTRLRLLVEAGWAGRHRPMILSGGEALTSKLAAQLLARGEVWNLYGPTECAVWTFARRVHDDASAGHIGGPFPKTRHVIRSADGKLAEAGELIIAGPQVGEGYWGRPVESNQAFIDDPELGRAYRTGDRVRALPSGNLAFEGRLDHQMKIGGTRVEPGEIERAVEEHVDVTQCVVVPVADVLVCHWRLEPDVRSPTPSAMKRHLSERLPTAAHPQHYVSRTSFPLTPSGKVDRRALAAEPLGPMSEAELSASARPASDAELVVSRAWQRVLGRAHVGRNQAFSDLGGSSLRTFEVITLVERWTGLTVPAAPFAARETIEKQAQLLEALQDGDAPSAHAVPLTEGSGPPLYCLCGVHLYAQLARALAPSGLPVWAVSLPSESELRKGAGGRPIVERFAEEAEAIIHQLHPGGPIRLAGVSFGGVVAFELARRLRWGGEEVELVVLFDAVLPGSSRRSLPRAVLAPARKRVLRWLDRARGGEAEGRARWNEAGFSGLDRWYESQPYGGEIPTLVLRAEERMEGPGATVKSDLGWSELTSGPVHVVETPGGHLGGLEAEGARVSAAAISSVLGISSTKDPTSARSNESLDLGWGSD